MRRGMKVTAFLVLPETYVLTMHSTQVKLQKQTFVWYAKFTKHTFAGDDYG